MHILHVTPYYPPAYALGGIPRIVQGLSEAMYEQGHHVTVLTTDICDSKRRVERPIFAVENGVHVYSVPNLSNRLAYYQQLYLPMLDRTYFSALERRAPIDIIHLHGHRHLLNTIVIAWAKGKGIPYVFTANGTLRRHEQKIALKMVWDAFISGRVPFDAAACIAVSEFDVQIHREWGIPAHKIHLLPNGMDLREFENLPPKGLTQKSLGLSENTPLITYLGRISPRKGVTHLVEAFQRLQHPEAHLVVAGSDMGGKEEALRKAGHHPNIHFLDTVSGQARLALLQDSRILMYPSQNEIFGLVPFEGLMSGAPTIVSDDCGCGEIITKAKAGLQIKFGRISQMISAMQTILETPSLGDTMVANGQHYIRSHFAMERVAQQHSTLYEELLTA